MVVDALVEYSFAQTYVDEICCNLVSLELKACRISHWNLSHHHVPQLVEAIGKAHKLRKLDIIRCPNLGPESIVELCGALIGTEVSHLSLEAVALGNAGLAAVTRLLQQRSDSVKNTSRIKYLDLEGSIDLSTIDFDVWNDFISVACQGLESLDLGRNGLSSPDQIAALCRAISSRGPSCPLRALVLSNNPLGDAGFEGLCQALKQNRNLVLLACGGCSITYSCGVRSLTDGLRSNPSLQRLYMYGNLGIDGNSTGVAFLDGPDSSELQYWLDLNGRGRGLLRNQEDCHPGLLPLVLERVSSQSMILYGLLREVPHVWNR